MGKNTLRYSLYAAAIVIILTLTGIFGTFEAREVLADHLTLSMLAWILMAGAPALLVALPLRERGPLLTTFNGAVSGFIIGLALLAVMLLEMQVGADELLFVFQNYNELAGGTLTFGNEGESLIFPGLLLLVGFSTLIGALSGASVSAPERLRNTLLLSAGLVCGVGIVENQISDVIALADALALILAAGGAYALAWRMQPSHLVYRLGIGFMPGAILGAALALIVNAGGVNEEGGFLLLGAETVPRILSGSADPLLPFVLIFGLTGAVGALLSMASRVAHNGGLAFLTGLFVLGLLNHQEGMTDLMILVSFAAIALITWTITPLAQAAAARYEAVPRWQQRGVNRLSAVAGLFVVLIAPIFMGQYITNVLDLVMLYIIMGIGLNVMVGFAGLLDLGYVASFAIGAYTSALLTTPSVITMGCVSEAAQQAEFYEMCVGLIANWQGTGLLTFWEAWPWAIAVAALTGMALGVPVLGLRGDYLAIVTLGFGEITRVLTRANVTKPLLGSAQGISPIPVPVLDLSFINPAWVFELNDAMSIYYLYVFAVLLAAYVVLSLAGARLGRAWRAMKADEDVAEAMGVHLVGTKLLAFGISSAFAGLGGAVFGAQLRGIFPDSFTLLVSINVLSLIIIGGLGSIPGVFLGALLLVGMPEVLRELQDYRLLVFGVILVVAMLLKPEGLIPPPVRRLSERASPSSSANNLANKVANTANTANTEGTS